MGLGIIIIVLTNHTQRAPKYLFVLARFFPPDMFEMGRPLEAIYDNLTTSGPLITSFLS